jgi:site-specific recombinase XerD
VVIVRAFKDYLIHLGLERRASEATMHAYEGDIAQFVEFLRGELSHAPGFTDAGSLAVRSFLGSLSRNGYSKRSIARKIASLKSFFAFCAARGLCADDPTVGVSSPRPGRDLPVFAGVAAMERMMTLPPADTKRGLRDRAVLELLYGTGMRLSELVGCSIERCDFAKGTISVLGKRKKERMVPLGGKAAESLKRYLQERFGAPASIWSSRETYFRFFAHRGTREGSDQPADGSADRFQVSLACGGSIAHEPSRLAAHIRDASSRRRGRPESGPGATRTREPLDDPDLYARHDGAAANGI